MALRVYLVFLRRSRATPSYWREFYLLRNSRKTLHPHAGHTKFGEAVEKQSQTIFRDI